MYKSACMPAVPLRRMSIPASCCNKSARLVAALFLISADDITEMVLEFSLNGKFMREEEMVTSPSAVVSCVMGSFCAFTMKEINKQKVKKALFFIIVNSKVFLVSAKLVTFWTSYIV